MMKSVIIKTLVFASCILLTALPCQLHAKGWEQSYAAGYKDDKGVYCGGSEVMHIVPHKGKLFAFNGFWKDRNFGKGMSSQVLRLDSPKKKWQVDLETTKEGLNYTQGNILHMKGNILKSVTFTTDKHGKKIKENILIGAANAFNINQERHQGTSVFVRNDKTGKWSHTIINPGPLQITPPGEKEAKRVRRVPRDIEIYRDPKTGIDRIFLLIGDFGIISGVYNSKTKQIEWDSKPECPEGGKVFDARALSIAEANGELYFSVSGFIYKRINGKKPTWKLAHTEPGRVNTDMGGIRGLTSIKNPAGPGDSLLFIWCPKGKCAGNVKRLDGKELKGTEETTLRKLFQTLPISKKLKPKTSLGGYNRWLPIKDPDTGKTFYLAGFQTRTWNEMKPLTWNNYYKGATYAIRTEDQKFDVKHVNGSYEPGKPLLIAPRAFAQSPFRGEKDVIYFGGHDSNSFESTDTAWIFKADIKTVLLSK